jgi:hypothetical protein
MGGVERLTIACALRGPHDMGNKVAILRIAAQIPL